LVRTPDGIVLVQRPVRELDAVRGEARGVRGREALGGAAEIELELPKDGWQMAGFRLSNDSGEEVTVGVTAEPFEVFVDRRRSRRTAFHEAYPERHAAPLRRTGRNVTLQAIVDRTTLEVFANGGETVISDRLFPTRPLDRLEPLDDGGSKSPRLILRDLTPRSSRRTATGGDQ
ncbi:MAG TPA: GH32 C-terminal domain-containing protein, partial [Vicinamibacterales bacterium]|nr:GH32 C-terminal domain-containing protein [Vicinamibacterales bacterium]